VKLFDLHADTLYECYKDRVTSLTHTPYHIDLNKLKAGDSWIQCLAVFNKRPDNGYDYEKMMAFIDYSIGLLNAHDNIRLIQSSDDIDNRASDKQYVMLTIEDLGPILENIDRIDVLYDLGFRMMSLTWNYENTLGYPNIDMDKINGSNQPKVPELIEFGDVNTPKPLKKFGIDVIEKMNERGIIIDVSHLNDGGFYDVAKHSKQPFIASHSNARAVKQSMRNLTDDMIHTLADAGGVMGINFCHAFLGDSECSLIADKIKHIQHIKKVGGIDCIAIGSDFDGIESQLEIEDVSQMNRLAKALEGEGFKTNEIEKIFYKNAMRVCRDVLK
jgi:membrane dipeptidase